MALSKYPLLQDKKWLQENYIERRRTQADVARIVGGGCTRAAVSYWAWKHGIRKPGHRVYPRREPKAYWPGHE